MNTDEVLKTGGGLVNAMALEKEVEDEYRRNTKIRQC